MIIKDKILELLKVKRELSVKELTDQLFVSKQAIHLALIVLLNEELVEKIGWTPKTIYRIRQKSETPKVNFFQIDENNAAYLKAHFLLISDMGKMLEGAEGFEYWCKNRKLPFEKAITEFIKTKEKYERFYNEFGIINGKEKLLNTEGYKEIFLDELFYLDFYAIKRFGKTRLGTLLHFAKQGQNKYLMKILMDEANQKIELLLKQHKFDAVGYVPPTIRREVQLIKFIESHSIINLPKINIQKISGIIPIPQKSLNKIEERINNAENSFAVKETVKYNHVLLIDDAVGSGSTLNQIAGKLKQKGIAKKITGLAIVGSFKGFDVITDV